MDINGLISNRGGIKYQEVNQFPLTNQLEYIILKFDLNTILVNGSIKHYGENMRCFYGRI